MALTLALSGCITPPGLEPPQRIIATADLGLSPQESEPVQAMAWWSAFGDPQLDRLMEQALAANPSLEQALARVREAQSLADVAQAGLVPSVSFDGQETRRRLSGHDPVPKPYPGTTQWQGSVGLNLSWNIDFWGRQAALLNEARAQTTAAALNLASARLALGGAVAQTYIDLYRNNALADVAEQSLAQRQRILEITRTRVGSTNDPFCQSTESPGSLWTSTRTTPGSLRSSSSPLIVITFSADIGGSL